MEICQTGNCTGCMACMNSCPYDAIQEKQNERGFYIPSVDEEKCVKCGLCRQVCPANRHEEVTLAPEVFACWNTDKEVRQYSSSGGMFTLLAKAVLEQGGVVFGVVFDPDTGIVLHKMARTLQELRAMVGSKYVQSRIGNTYRKVKTELDAGRQVLFSGTPCQCAGLKSFLAGQPENLYLIDLVCHGVPSPAVFKVYLNAVAGDMTVKKINFREKQPSWELFSIKLTINHRDEYLRDMNSDPYLRLFLGNYNLNNCCYNCKYANISRCSDVTLGDFWGYLSEKRGLRDNNKGISLVMVNTHKGRKLFEKVKHQAVYTVKSIDEAIAGNWPLAAPSPCAEDSDVFWREFLADSDIQELTVLKKPPARPSLRHRIRLCMDRYYYLMPTGIKKKYKRLKLKNAYKKRNAFLK